MTPAEEQAARFTGALWKAIRFAGGVHAGQFRLFPGAYDPGWLAGLPLPAGAARPAGQPVALLDSRHHEFERHLDDASLRDAYASRPRTRVLEDIGHGEAQGWYALAARHLGRLSGSELHVTCSVFESRSGDETFGAHRDTWFGGVVVMAGAKDWDIGEGLLDDAKPAARKVTTRAGDILVLPKNLPHIVSTPANPGHSVHLAFAIDRDSPEEERERRTGADEGDDARAAARADLARAVRMSEELLEAHMSSAGYRTSAEWLAALVERTRVLNGAAREYLKTGDATRSPA